MAAGLKKALENASLYRLMAPSYGGTKIDFVTLPSSVALLEDYLSKCNSVNIDKIYIVSEKPIEMPSITIQGVTKKCELFKWRNHQTGKPRVIFAANKTDDNFNSQNIFNTIRNGDTVISDSIGIILEPNPEFYYRNAENLEWAYSLLADKESKQIYAGRVKAICTGKSHYIKISPYPQYFHPLLKLSETDVIIDGGIGESVSTIHEFERKAFAGSIYSFEPIPALADGAAKEVKEKPWLSGYSTIVPYGLSNETGTVQFAYGPNGDSRISLSSDNQITCQITTIDDFVSKRQIRKIDLIKLDVEGSELSAIQGGSKSIAQHRPNIMISAYHRDDDLWTLMQEVYKIDNNYKFYFGHHTGWFYESVIYAINSLRPKDNPYLSTLATLPARITRRMRRNWLKFKNKD